MKHQIVITISFVFMIFFNPAMAWLIQEDTVKEIACKHLEADSRLGVLKQDCLKGSFDIIKQENRTINGEEIATLLKIRIEFEKKDFTLLLLKKIQVDNNGNLLPGDWLVNKIEINSLGSYAIILKANVGDANVIQLTDMNNVPSQVKNWEYYSSAPDYNLETVKYFAIFDTGDLNTVVGYIVEEYTTCTENEDQNDLVSARFDLKGNMIGEIEFSSWE